MTACGALSGSFFNQRLVGKQWGRVASASEDSQMVTGEGQVHGRGVPRQSGNFWRARRVLAKPAAGVPAGAVRMGSRGK